ncbi:hypothetical protein AB685_17095 [Bacillus sp. LL01]|uniref:DMP19 family protein n=1 Tax=Bacillus sp. LL01 TaxID=1665556 RepID=UPI00064D4A34|nr:hypothetical protein [Bacillus sp. LL01]KMJ57132.1 hypothetical protein AB685_17095 [Bacillus sp. LL01]
MDKKVKNTELTTNEDIWNAMVSLMSEYDFPTDNETANQAFMVYHYYSELESAGHEGLFNWCSSYIEELGAARYFEELVRALREINATDYALIEEKYGVQLWKLYQALESGEAPEEEFYNIIEKADNEYWQLDGKLGNMLETYFVGIYKEFIEVVDE